MAKLKTGQMVALVCLMMTVPLATAQGATVEFAEVGKFIDHLQVAAGSVIVNPGPFDPGVSGPYGFIGAVGGMDLAGADAPVLSGPMTNGEPSHNGGVLGYNAEVEEWRYGAPAFNVVTAATKAGLDALFPAGTYTFSNVLGAMVSVDLPDDAYPNTPVMTLTGGSWIGGSYSIDVTQPLTITTNAFAAYGTHPADWMSLEMVGLDVDVYDELFSLDTPASNVLSLTLPANTLVEGELYDVWAEYGTIVEMVPIVAHPDGFGAISSFNVETYLTVQAIPEPTAMMLLVAGGLALLRRR